jgi:mannosyltransferase OCH1-like enzyme
MNKIQSFWYGQLLSTMERLSINSFLKNGHDVEIYSYGQIDNLPKGVILRDARDILPKDKLFLDSAGSIASFSDWFRYKLLYEKGGWWIDLDVVCLRSFEDTPEYCFATENDSNTYGTGITCCIIKSEAKSAFLKMILDYINSFPDYHDISWGEFGPALLHSVVQKFDSAEYIKDVHVFCPINWKEMNLLTEPNISFPNESMAIHMWNNLWGINKMDKEGTYHPDSIYEKLKIKYL